MRIRKLNKKGYSMSSWTEGIILSLLIVIMFGFVVSGMNSLYGENYSIGLGTNASNDDFVAYQSTLQNEITTGEAEFDASQGLTLKSSWGILKNISSIIWNFITGGWIETITTDWIGLPAIFGSMFRMLYFISLGLIILYLLFKVEV